MLLAGLRVLLVEDETMVSFLLEDMLLDLGSAAVLHASSVDEALRLLSVERPDVAILDVNLGGKLVYPVAERLAEAGIPFAFATGYGRAGLAERWCEQAVIQKPFALERLARAIRQVLADRC
jgi:CheY-like chemotaxis protein